MFLCFFHVFTLNSREFVVKWLVSINQRKLLCCLVSLSGKPHGNTTVLHLPLPQISSVFHIFRSCITGKFTTSRPVNLIGSEVQCHHNYQGRRHEAIHMSRWCRVCFSKEGHDKLNPAKEFDTFSKDVRIVYGKGSEARDGILSFETKVVLEMGLLTIMHYYGKLCLQ